MKSSRPLSSKEGGSILDVMEEIIEVGQTMGYNMEGCAKNIEDIIGLQGDYDELNYLDASEISQKAKVHWSIEGDENSKYFHGILNKKEISTCYSGHYLINVNGFLIPVMSKREFYSHFKNQFLPSYTPRLSFDFVFPNRLSTDQVEDLERLVTYDEVKRAVWDCGANKSPGPDGFTFEFFRNVRNS
ncbi:hypothetical protein Tco_0465846 [Tanacetum coccineum]